MSKAARFFSSSMVSGDTTSPPKLGRVVSLCAELVEGTGRGIQVGKVDGSVGLLGVVVCQDTGIGQSPAEDVVYD